MRPQFGDAGEQRRFHFTALLHHILRHSQGLVDALRTLEVELTRTGRCFHTRFLTGLLGDLADVLILHGPGQGIAPLRQRLLHVLGAGRGLGLFFPGLGCTFLIRRLPGRLLRLAHGSPRLFSHPGHFPDDLDLLVLLLHRDGAVADFLHLGLQQAHPGIRLQFQFRHGQRFEQQLQLIQGNVRIIGGAHLVTVPHLLRAGRRRPGQRSRGQAEGQHEAHHLGHGMPRGHGRHGDLGNGLRRAGRRKSMARPPAGGRAMGVNR